MFKTVSLLISVVAFVVVLAVPYSDVQACPQHGSEVTTDSP